MIIVVGDTPSSVEINAGGRLGDPSKMAAAQYVSSNRQRHKSVYVDCVGFSDVFSIRRNAGLLCKSAM